MNRLIVEKDAVVFLAVLSEGFAVVGHDGDQSRVEETACLENLQQLPDHKIGVRDFSVIRLRLGPRLIRLRRIIGIMRIVQMYP